MEQEQIQIDLYGKGTEFGLSREFDREIRMRIMECTGQSRQKAGYDIQLPFENHTRPTWSYQVNQDSDQDSDQVNPISFISLTIILGIFIGLFLANLAQVFGVL